ncbi:hypothetical protein [Streptomyces diastatochromogenes]|uniref:hypothetical protein n=1 Tax=Streptomyces diastatochromogenes TaxID=42236 RepID=UPI001FC96B60|nr:hypothetical protein [Streptomyces diastatochromogenes]MCZ0990685.1 hypothetical protein [Streptomyces diastatochromogenes]
MRGTPEDLVRAAHAASVTDARLLEAVRTIPRAAFVPADEVASAYRDTPVPLPHGQVTTQPSPIAMMVSALGLTGSCWRAAPARAKRPPCVGSPRCCPPTRPPASPRRRSGSPAPAQRSTSSPRSTRTAIRSPTPSSDAPTSRSPAHSSEPGRPAGEARGPVTAAPDAPKASLSRMRDPPPTC